jgi:hypothetical protein
MKKLFLLPVAGLMLVSSISCKKVNEATEFDINYASEVSVPAASLTLNAPVDFTSPEISTDTGNKFAENETTRDLIDEIKLTRLFIASLTGNLDFVKSINVYVKAPGLQDLLVATKSNIPAGSTSVLLDPTGQNIKEHLFKDKIQFRLNVTVGTAPTTDQKLKIEETVHVAGKKIK